MEMEEAKKIPIGAFLVKTWGYEQTNVDFVQVVENTGKTLKVKPVGSKIVSQTANYTGEVVPGEELHDGKEFRVRIMPYSKTQPHLAYLGAWHVWDGAPKWFSSYA